jgi:hypothetical protein
MKILITSDIHNDIKSLEKVLKEHPDIDFHLDAGDSNLSLDELEKRRIISVERVLEFEGKKILLVHGHSLKVKRGKNLLYSVANSFKVDYCVFGHTHKQEIEDIRGIIFVNPGSLLDGRYAIYENDKFKLYELKR